MHVAKHRRIAKRWMLGGTLIVCTMLANASQGATSVASVVSAVADIECHLAIAGTLSRKQPAVLELTLHNRGKQALSLLRRNTPFEGWLADSMRVERDGQLVPYSGAMAKRMPPTATEYLRLAAGAQRRFRIKLQGGYDVAAAGNYRVAWSGDVMDAYHGTAKPDPERMTAQTIACAPVGFTRTP
jgi:hypothetical protein